MMKKFLCNILIIVFATACFGCTGVSTTIAENEPETTTETPTEPPTPETYVYSVSCATESFKSSNSANIVEVSNITHHYDKNSNPTKIYVNFKVTKTYQGSRLGLMENYTEDNTIFITLYDVNGNQIGQKEVVTSLKEKDDSSTYYAVFQVTPGTYSIKLTGEDQ